MIRLNMRHFLGLVFSVNILLSIFSSSSFAQNDFDKLFSRLNSFLNENVKNGTVNYSAIKSNSKELTGLLEQLKNIDLTGVTDKNYLTAFWINAYNLIVIKTVVQNYPLDSPQQVSGFFNSIKHNVAGELLTSDEIEHEKLFKIKKDPRFHFVVVCAAAGCPKIIDRAYLPEDLETLLNERTKITVNNDYYVKYNRQANTVYLNEIFKWYKKDFEESGLSVTDFINQFRAEKIPGDASIKYISYDWSLNRLPEETRKKKDDEISLQQYTPAVLLKNGQFEIKIFNNLYTQTSFFDESGGKVDANARNTFFTSLISFLYGVPGNINLGFEFWIFSVRNDTEDSSPFSLFKLEGPPSGRTAVSRIGPKIKFAPFSSGFFGYIKIQSTFLIPATPSLEGTNTSDGKVIEPYLDDDAHLWYTQFFYDRRLGTDFSFFGEIDIWWKIDRELNGNNRWQFPLKLFLNYYPNNDITIYGMHEFSFNIERNSSTGFYDQAGLGIKYQFLPWIELEGLITAFYIGQNSGAGQTFNLGFRLVN